MSTVNKLCVLWKGYCSKKHWRPVFFLARLACRFILKAANSHCGSILETGCRFQKRSFNHLYATWAGMCKTSLWKLIKESYTSAPVALFIHSIFTDESKKSCNGYKLQTMWVKHDVKETQTEHNTGGSFVQISPPIKKKTGYIHACATIIITKIISENFSLTSRSWIRNFHANFPYLTFLML